MYRAIPAPTAGLRKSLHWLPIRQRISYIATLTFKVRFHGQLVYLADSSPSTLRLEHCIPAERIYSSFSGSRRNSPPEQFVSLLLEHGTTCQFTYGRQLPQATSGNNLKQICLTMNIINHHGLSQHLQLAVSIKDLLCRDSEI